MMEILSHSRRQVFNLGFLALLLSSQQTQSFSLGTNSPPILSRVTKHRNTLPCASFVCRSQIITSLSSESNDDNEPARSVPDTPTFPKTPPPPTEERLDSLVQSLTQMDDDLANGPTRNIPLFGEVPADGSILILAPVTLIAVIGFILTIQMAFTSKDVWIPAIDELNAQLSKPPVKETVVTNNCRGLCSDQDGQLESMRSFMQSLAPPKPEVENLVVGVEKVQAPAVETKVEEDVYGGDIVDSSGSEGATGDTSSSPIE